MIVTCLSQSVDVKSLITYTFIFVLLLLQSRSLGVGAVFSLVWGEWALVDGADGGGGVLQVATEPGASFT